MHKIELSKKKTEYEKPQNQEAILRAFMSTEFLIKFQDEDQWKERYLKLQNTCLLVYKHKNVRK